MRWPRWLVSLFPRLAPQGAWADAVIVTDPRRIARLHVLYAQAVVWVRARKPDALQSPECRVVFRVWPTHLRAPAGFGLGQVLAPNVIAGDTHGTLLVRKSLVGDDALLIHEAKHAITGESGHPDWLFGRGA